jgi:hypothetical protein
MGMSTTVPSRQAEILARTIGADDAGLSEEAARSLLTLQITDTDRDRVNQLAAQSRDGSLNEEERAELDDYERVASLLELLQSKARLSLKRAGLS